MTIVKVATIVQEQSYFISPSSRCHDPSLLSLYHLYSCLFFSHTLHCWAIGFIIYDQGFCHTTLLSSLHIPQMSDIIQAIYGLHLFIHLQWSIKLYLLGGWCFPHQFWESQGPFWIILDITANLVVRFLDLLMQYYLSTMDLWVAEHHQDAWRTKWWWFRWSIWGLYIHICASIPMIFLLSSMLFCDGSLLCDGYYQQ